jgi:anti-sigma B factor antagonist
MPQPRQVLDLNFLLQQDVAVVTVKGRITIGKVEEFDKFLQDLISAGRRKFVLDLKDLDHIDSCGIGVLICFNERVKKIGGAIRVANPHPKILKIFTMMSLDAFFSILPDVPQAIRSMDGKA